MGFWGTLGKIGLGVLGVGGGIASGRAEGRQAEAQTQNEYDRRRLEAARLQLQQPGMLARNAVQGDTLANVQPVSYGPYVRGQGRARTGGLSPALFSANTRQLGQNMSRDALLQSLKGPVYTPTPLPKRNFWDKLLTGAGYAGAFAGAIDQQRKDQPQLPGYSKGPF